MISLQPTEDQKLVIDTIQRFVKEKVVKARHDADENRALPDQMVKEGWGLGILAGWIPEEFEGVGEALSATNGALYAEELGYGDVSLALRILGPGAVGIPILQYGTDEQKKRWLPALAEDKIPAMSAAWVEPQWDYDPMNPTTTATRQGDNYVLNGRKALVINAKDADVILVYAKEGDTVQAFLVEKGAQGLTIGEREQYMGLRALETYEISLENCTVPAAARLGGEAGCDACRLMSRSRVGLAAVSVGLARQALEMAMNYAKERQAFGRFIAQFQSIAFFLAEMAIDVDGARLLVWEAAWAIDKGEDGLRQGALAKQFADDTVLMVCDRALQIFGGHGYIRDNQVEMFLRNARAFAVTNGIAIV